MPNWVRNDLEITGPEAELERFMAECFTIEAETPRLDFDRLIPMPATSREDVGRMGSRAISAVSVRERAFSPTGTFGPSGIEARSGMPTTSRLRLPATAARQSSSTSVRHGASRGQSTRSSLSAFPY